MQCRCGLRTSPVSSTLKTHRGLWCRLLFHRLIFGGFIVVIIKWYFYESPRKLWYLGRCRTGWTACSKYSCTYGKYDQKVFVYTLWLLIMVSRRRRLQLPWHQVRHVRFFCISKNVATSRKLNPSGWYSDTSTPIAYQFHVLEMQAWKVIISIVVIVVRIITSDFLSRPNAGNLRISCCKTGLRNRSLNLFHYNRGSYCSNKKYFRL